MSLDAEALTLTRSGKALVDQVSCSIVPGRRLAIIGRNGAGKSSLLGLLAGYMGSYMGSVRLDNKPLQHWRAPALARRRACLTQNAPIMLPFSVSEIIRLGAEPFSGRVPRRTVNAVLEDLTRRYEIDDLLENCCDTLSGGEVQRVHIVRVLLQAMLCHEGSAYLLLDEPAAALDLVHQQTLWEHITELARQGFGIAFVTHDLDLVPRCADQVCMLRKGRRYAYGGPRAAMTDENMQAVFDVRVPRVPAT